jgi:hypothetical protein
MWREAKFMKAGYLTLFSLAVAYSAYQGAVPSMPSAVPTHTMASTSSENRADAATPSTGPTPPSVESFSTISSGMWAFSKTLGPTPNCGDAKAICPTDDLSQLIEDYFRADLTDDAKYLEAHWNVPRARQDHIKFVIASLPDPVRTHMALLFDRAIETIQSSAQASGYLFSRAWMPWDISAHNESTDFTVRMAQEKYRDRLEALPGLMIFQKPGDAPGGPPNVLFVFVVGETPTGGLRIEQFQNALKIRERMLDGAGPKLAEATVLRIDGPTFSGSLSSLEALLKTQQSRLSAITIRSGSISSYHAVRDFCDSTHRWPNAGAVPDFKTFQFSDAYEEFYLKLFFYDRSRLHYPIAVLSEDETPIGKQEVY